MRMPHRPGFAPALLALLALPAGAQKAGSFEPVRTAPDRAVKAAESRDRLAFRNVITQVSGTFADPTPLSAYTGLDSDVHGPGGCFVDFDLDGWQDLYLPEENSRNYLYRNVSDGVGGRKFRQVTEYLIGVDPSYRFHPTGAIAGDFDNDGDYDIYVINSNKGVEGIFGSLECGVTKDAENMLLRNRWIEDGVLRFEDVTAATDPTPGVADDQHGVGTAFDVLLPGAMREELDDTVTAAWADVDRDGDLDLFVGNHDNHGQSPVPDPCDVEDKYGQRDILYLNLLGESETADGVPHFADVTLGTITLDGMNVGGQWIQESDPVTGWQLPRNYESNAQPGWTGKDDGFESDHQRFSSTNAAMFADVNMDLWPDLIVTNKVYGNDCRDRDMLYLNLGADAEGNWRGFRMATYAIYTPQTSPAPCDAFGANNSFGAMTPGAMGVDVADFDGDGDMDMFFSDRGISDLWENLMVDLGIPPGEDPVFSHSFEEFIWGWGVRWDDWDNNGLLDLHVTTRNTDHDWMWLQTPGSEIGTDMSVELGSSQGGALGPWVHSRANITADYDQDGWLDSFIVNRNNPPSALLRNQMGSNEVSLPDVMANDTSTFKSLNLRLVGNTSPDPGTGFASTLDAVGALIRVDADFDGDGSVESGEVTYREVHAASGNAAGSSDFAVHFGLRRASSATVDITWPSGRTSNFVVSYGPGEQHKRLTVTEGL